MMKNLQGIIPPVVTPLHPDGSLDLDSLDELLEFLLEAGVHGLFLLGSSGQVAYLSDAQREAVVTRAVERVEGRVPVLVGVCDLSARRVVDEAQRMTDLGGD